MDTDKALADAVRDAAQKLQESIHAADEAGLAVTIDTVTASRIGKKYPLPFVTASVARPL